MCRCTGRDIDTFLLVDLFDVGISSHTGISCDNLVERVLRAMTGHPAACPESDGKRKEVLKSLSIQKETKIKQSNPSLHCFFCCLCRQKCHWES